MKDFEVVLEARGASKGKRRTEVDLEWTLPRGQVEAYHLATDESPTNGGENTAPPPLAFFATALVACLLTQIRAFSETMDISVYGISASASFRWQAHKFGNEPHEAEPDQISVDFTIESNASEGDLIRLIAAARSGSFVEQTLTKGIPISHRLRRQGGWTSL